MKRNDDVIQTMIYGVKNRQNDQFKDIKSEIVEI